MFYDPNAKLKKLKLIDFLPTDEEIKKYQFIIERAKKKLISKTFYSVEPLPMPSSLLFYLDFIKKPE